MPEETPVDGIQLDLISGDRLSDMGSAEKISTILDSVKEGKIVVLEEGLTPDEESRLVEKTMASIQPDGFSGVEIETYPQTQASGNRFVNRLLSREEQESKMTVIGPANKIETLHKDESLISTLVSSN